MVDLHIGDKATITKIFTLEEVKEYSRTSQDTNPIHYDFDYAAKTTFKNPIVQGLLASSLFGGILGTTLPGKGTVHLGQSLKFIKPIFIGEKVVASIEIISIREDKPIITFKTVCRKENEEIAIEGEAVVYYKGEVFI